jgi:hypothetical protein
MRYRRRETKGVGVGARPAHMDVLFLIFDLAIVSLPLAHTDTPACTWMGSLVLSILLAIRWRVLPQSNHTTAGTRLFLLCDTLQFAPDWSQRSTSVDGYWLAVGQRFNYAHHADWPNQGSISRHGAHQTTHTGCEAATSISCLIPWDDQQLCDLAEAAL